jgi:hypothetical protein
MDSDLPGDSPPPVTDLSPALDEVEEIEEIEHLEDVEVPLPPVDAVSTGTPASLRVLPERRRNRATRSCGIFSPPAPRRSSGPSPPRRSKR